MRKQNRTYYFSVEGDTEHWYLMWLQSAINADPKTRYTVTLKSKVEKDPITRAKQLTIVGRTQITHLMDYESEQPIHVQQFKTTLDRMDKVQNSGKTIQYQLGYSNFAFELWIVLHKENCNGTLAYRHQYLAALNKAYDVNFENLDQYKQDKNFHRVLDKLTLDEVRQAIRRAKEITQRNAQQGYVLQNYRNYTFYKENPSLSIDVVVEKILQDCKLL